MYRTANAIVTKFVIALLLSILSLFADHSIVFVFFYKLHFCFFSDIYINKKRIKLNVYSIIKSNLYL